MQASGKVPSQREQRAPRHLTGWHCGAGGGRAGSRARSAHSRPRDRCAPGLPAQQHMAAGQVAAAGNRAGALRRPGEARSRRHVLPGSAARTCPAPSTA